MHQHIYFNVALQSADSFKQLVKIIPDLYRWFKCANNRDFIIKHFTYGSIGINHKTKCLRFTVNFDQKYNVREYRLTDGFYEQICENGLKVLNGEYPANDNYTKVIYASYINHELHSENDNPAVIIVNKVEDCVEKRWFKNGILHRPANDQKYGTANEQQFNDYNNIPKPSRLILEKGNKRVQWIVNGVHYETIGKPPTNIYFSDKGSGMLTSLPVETAYRELLRNTLDSYFDNFNVIHSAM